MGDGAGFVPGFVMPVLNWYFLLSCSALGTNMTELGFISSNINRKKLMATDAISSVVSRRIKK